MQIKKYSQRGELVIELIAWSFVIGMIFLIVKIFI